MGLGGTAKKVQKLADTAEKLYGRVNDIREQLHEMQATTAATNERVDRLEVEVAEQRALLEALAEEEGIDVDSVTADAHIDRAEAGAADPADAGEASEATDDRAASASAEATDSSAE